MAKDAGEQWGGRGAVYADLLLVVVSTLLTAVFVFVPALAVTPVRTGVGLVFVLFVPGYVLVAVLFPGDGSRDEPPVEPTTNTTWVPLGSDGGSGVDGLERAVLSFVASVALAALTGLTLGLADGGIGLASVFLVLGAVTVVGVPLVVVSRSRLPPHRRFRGDLGTTVGSVRASLFEPDSAAEAGLNVVLVVLLLLTLVAVGTGGQASDDGTLTEFYLLTPDDDGEFTPTDYPSTLDPEGTELAIRLGNYEGERRTYTTVVLLQRVETATDSGDLAVREETELDRFRTTLAANETARHEHTVTASGMSGEDLRLVYLLYVDEPPADPTVANAYRELHVWVDVPALSARYASPLRVEASGPTTVTGGVTGACR
jgi:uncharacterized membrane protein